MAESLSKANGEKVVYNEISPETYRSFGFPGADDLGNMFQFYRDFNDAFAKLHDVKFAKELNPELKSFDMWLAENAKRIQLDYSNPFFKKMKISRYKCKPNR